MNIKEAKKVGLVESKSLDELLLANRKAYKGLNLSLKEANKIIGEILNYSGKND